MSSDPRPIEAPITGTGTSHTPTPWTLSVTEFNGSRDGVGASILDADGTFIADVWADFEAGPDEKPIDGIALHGTGLANAALIVRAVNERKELLDALKLARRVLSVACGEDAPYIREAFRLIDPVIAKADTP